jgi:GWxTD domain-containing protein
LYPISDVNERTWGQNQITKKDLNEMQRFFLGFWKNRNPTNPEQAWLAYLQQVKAVQKEFGTQIKKGYETDRGRVYLQYGAPHQRTQSTPEPSAYPYEIWQYYQLPDGQANRKFVFYNPDLVTNDYRLIHSTAQGEIYDTRWELRVHNRNNQSRDFDEENSQDHLGGQTKDLFNNPR